MKRIKVILTAIWVLITYPFIKLYNWLMRKQEVSEIRNQAEALFKDKRKRERFFAEMNRARRKKAFKIIK